MEFIKLNYPIGQRSPILEAFRNRLQVAKGSVRATDKSIADNPGQNISYCPNCNMRQASLPRHQRNPETCKRNQQLRVASNLILSDVSGDTLDDQLDTILNA